ncbi:RNA polymerase sigma factor, partial [Cryptosporangium phraense]
MDDVALVAAVQRGDEEALADLFEECHGWTYSTCLNALRDPDAAQEATARVFEVSVRTRLAGARELRPAMLRLIHDACLEVEQELGKKRWLRRKGEQPPAAPDPKELRLVAWRAAGDLSGPDRILFALSAGAGLTVASIAAAIDAEKPAAVAKRLDAIREHVVADVLAARSLDDCPELRDTLRYSAKEPDDAARKKVHAHVGGRGKTPACPKCAKAYERWPLPALAALLPLTAVPVGLNDVVLDRMERALRAVEDASTDVIPIVDTGSYAVIDAATGVVIDPEPKAAPGGRHAEPAATPATAASAASAA